MPAPFRVLRPIRSILLFALLATAAACEREPVSVERADTTAAGADGGGSTVRPAVVISQIYGGGGNANAPYTHDYVELFNTTDAAVSVAGWRIHYASSSGISWSNTVTLPVGASIAAGSYYLVQLSGGATGVALPTPDATGSINMAAGSGKVVLTSTAVSLPGEACPDPATLVDRVGFGSTNCTTWTSTPVLSNITAALRGDNGCAYGTAADFSAGTPAPRNSSSPTNECDGEVDPVVVSVAVTPSSATISTGATQAFTATAQNAGGQSVATTFTWTSSDPAVATVSAAGVATGVADGTATITATSANGVEGTATLTVNTVAPPSHDIVISQIYGGGGNANAHFSHDYVELFNRGTTTADVSGWIVHYASTSGTSWVGVQIPAGSSIPAGGYFLVQLATNNATVGSPLPAPDATGGTNMAAGAGKVVLSESGVTLSSVACPDDAGIVDRVNFGSANCAATWGQTGTLSASVAAFRNGGGCVQTGNNTNDFSTAAPAPRNSSSLRNVCAGPTTATVSPANATVQAGGTVQLTASGFAADGQPTAASFSWSSSDVSVATVHPTSGVVTGVAAGTATVTAMAQNGVTGSASVEVTTPPPATGLVITEFLANPEGDDTVAEWFEMYNAGSTAVDLQGWRIRSNSSSGLETHTIAASVVVPAGGFVVLGNNTNTATNGGAPVAYSYGGDIILNNSNTDWFVIARPDGAAEDSVAYSTRDATGTIISPQFTPSNATSRVLINVDLDNSVAGSGNWQNSTMSFGDGRNLGSPGWGAYGVAGPVASVVVSPAAGAVLVGGTVGFSSLALDALGRVSTETLSWSSANTAIATIDAAGTATGVAEGITTVTATAASGVSGTASLAVVTPESPATLTVGVSDPGYFVVGIERRLFATVRNWENVVISPTPPVTWTVTPSNLARVNTYIGADGFARAYLEALAPGTVEVRGTAENGVFGVRSITIQPADAPTTAVYRNHVEFGMPSAGGTFDDIIVERPGFVSSWNQTRGGPNWVSWNLNATHFGGVSRCDCFSPDQLLPAGTAQVFDSDYIGSGYDRGHMVQSESRTTTQQENAATFLFTNILPQAGANNQQTWLAFENHLNGLAQAQGREVYIVAGGEYVASPQTLNNAGRVHIPDWTWKVAVVMPAGQGLANVQDLSSLQVIAVRMPNLVATAPGGGNWQQFMTTVDAIEAGTGLDLLSALPDWMETIIESGTQRPTAASGGPYGGAEGSAVAFDGSASSDPDAGDVLSFHWDFGDGTTATGATPSHTYADNGSFNVRLIVSDQFGAADTTYTTATIANAPPVITSLTVPVAAEISTPANATVTWTDAGSADTHQVTFDWGDGTSTTVAGANGSATASHSYGSVGFHTVSVTVTDDDNDADTRVAERFIAVHHPSSSVTGEGTVDAPAGAYTAAPGVAGKVSIALNTRIRNGAVTGTMEARLNQANFRFTADSFAWLVADGGRATLHGTGSIRNVAGVHTFTLYMEDGRAGSASARIVVRDAAGDIVFDSLRGEADGVLAQFTGAINVRP